MTGTHVSTISLQRLDPRSIRPNRYSGRHRSAFATPRFDALKSSLAHDGGNVVPVCVRLLPDGDAFELSYGAMRVQGCLELGLPALAIVDPLDDRDLVLRMFRDNERSDRLSPFEHGTQLLRVIEAGLFPSRRRLAEFLGSGLLEVSDHMQLALLPQQLLDAFPSVLDLKVAWGRRLALALERDPDNVLRRAGAIASSRQALTAAKVYAQLVAPTSTAGAAA